MEQKSSYRYVICACSAGLMLINMGLLSTAFSAYFPYMREIKNFTNTQLYLLPTIRSISTILFTMLCDRYYRHFGLKKGCLGALLCTALGFLFLAIAPGFWLYEVSMVLFGFSYAMGAMIPASLLVRQWFPKHSAGAMGIVTSGTGISFVFLPMYIRAFVYKIGLEMTLALETAAIVVLTIIIFVLIKEAPGCSAFGGEVSSSKTKAVTQQVNTVLTGGQHIRLYVAFFCMGVVGLTGVSGLSMLFSTTGHTTEMAGEMVSTFGFALIAGKLIYGVICDRYGSFITNCIYSACLTIGLIMLCMVQDAPYLLCICASLVFSIGCCLASVGTSIIAGDMSTKATFSKTLKNLQFIYSIGGFISGTVPGIIADFTGSYVPAYWLFLAASILFAVMVLPLYFVRKLPED